MTFSVNFAIISLKCYVGKESFATKSFNPLAAAIIITISTALILAQCLLKPEYAAATLIIYISTMLFMSIILAIAGWMYKKKRTSLDRNELTDVTEDLNTETIIWADDFSYIFINKKLRDLLGVPKSSSYKKSGVLKAFGLCAPNRAALDLVFSYVSHDYILRRNE